jgi:hypothetical protein
MSRAGDRSRYEVKVEGGKGAVIGDYATVVQVFKDAPRPLASQIRTQEFASLIAERTRRFVGREYVFAAIDEALADDDLQSGYVVLRGEPGIGKTAIISRLVHDRACVHHFNVAPLGIRSPQAFLANVCAQLIVRYALDHESLPPEATQDGGFLARLLAEAAEEEANHPIVVAVDALDEAEHVGLPPGANRLFLPPGLPAGVWFVVSTREEAQSRLYADPMVDIYVRDDDPRNLADVKAYIGEYIEANRERMQSRIDEWRVEEADFVDVLTEKSAGNFMYLVHVLRDIARGALTPATVDDIDKLPDGLRRYYQRHWQEMRSANPVNFARYQQPVVCLLATAREPVDLERLLEWTCRYWEQQGWDPNELEPMAVKDVFGDWREFLNEDELSGERRYRVYHASFQDFLADEVDLVTYHATIGASALAKIPGFAGH